MLDRPQALVSASTRAIDPAISSRGRGGTPDTCPTVNASAAAPPSAGSSAMYSFAFALPRTSAPCISRGTGSPLSSILATAGTGRPTSQGWGTVSMAMARLRRCVVCTCPPFSAFGRDKLRGVSDIGSPRLSRPVATVYWEKSPLQRKIQLSRANSIGGACR